MALEKQKLFITTHKKQLLLGAGAALVVGAIVFVVLRTSLAVQVSYGASDQAVEQPLVMAFSQTVRPIDASQVTISPKIEGEWKFASGKLFGRDTLQFVPHGAFRAGTTYTVKFADTKRLIVGDYTAPDVVFSTEKAPALANVSIPKTDDMPVIAADQPITLELASANKGLRELKLSTEPELPFDVAVRDDKVFEWKPQGLLPQGTEVKVVVHDTKNDEKLVEQQVRVAPEPKVATPVKATYFGRADTARIVFSEPIEQSSANIVFSLEGAGAWKDDTTYEFTPKGVEPGKTYQYSIKAGLRSKAGGVTVQDITAEFATPGAVAVTSITPQNKEVSQAAQDIRVTFDQPVVKKSAEDRFSVTSGTVTSFRWQGTTLIASVKDLGFQRTVRAAMAAGVEPEFGLAGAAGASAAFTTESRTVKLAVPYYRQAFAQSCEAASLRMALAYRGVQDSDWNILQKFGYNPRPRDQAANIWDDPNQQFVGDVNGDQRAGTGWGVYAGPVARAAGAYGRGTSVAYGANASFVASQIHAGNPVIAWGVWGGGARIESWQTPSGNTVSGPIPMHVRLITGVKGEPDNPIGFYVSDPISGQTYWTRQQFIANTSAAGPAAQLLAIQ